MFHASALLAFDWVDLAVKGAPVLMFVFWLVHQAVSEMKPKKPAPAPRAKPAPGAGPNPAKPPREVADEIEEFLKRAAAKRARGEDEVEVLVPAKRQAERPRQAPTKPRVIVVGQDTEATPQQPPRRRPVQARPQPQAARRVAPAAQEAVGSGVSEHAEQSIASRSFEDQTSHLGETVAGADERLAARLQAKFDHQVGRLDHEDRPVKPAKPVSSIAADIAKMLSSPQGVRQAVVLNEILTRPEERW